MGGGDFVGNIMGSLVIVLIIFVAIFLVFRELFCWYWKINEMVGLLVEIRDHLASQNPAASAARGEPTLAFKAGQAVGQMAGLATPTASNSTRCPICNESNAPDTRFCTNCGVALN